MKERLLSAVLAGSMMLTMLPSTAFAAEAEQEFPVAAETQSGTKQMSEQVTVLENADASQDKKATGNEQKVTSEETLKAALKGAKPGDTVIVTGEISSLSESVTIPNGVTLNVGEYLIKAGTIIVEPDATLAVASDVALNGKQAQEIVGPSTLANSSGNIEVTFADTADQAGDGSSANYETTIAIPVGTTAEIKGACMNNTGKGDTSYRLPKKDGMIVSGTLTISHDTTIAGELIVGPASAENGIIPLAANNGTVIVKSGETLNIGKNYNADGEIIVEAGATLKAGEDELIGKNSIDLTSGTATVAFGTYDADSKTYDTAITLKGDAEAKGSGVWSKDALTVESGTLKVSSAFNVKGTMTVSKDAKVIVADKGALNLCYSTGVSHTQGTLQVDGAVTIQKGGTLHVNEYGATGTINVDAGAGVLVTDADHGDDNKDEEMIGNGSLNITKGTATVAFTQAGTSVSIPADCEAEIAGPFMDEDAYRLPKNDSMSVAGKLTVKKDSNGNAFGGMEVTGKLDVAGQGIVAVESGKLELVQTVSGQNQGSLSIAQNASVEVRKDATLNIEKGTITASGKVYTEEGATFTASEEQKEDVTVVDKAKALTFTFDPNGGQFTDGTSAKKAITTSAHPSTKAPTGLTKTGYTFNGWSGLSADANYTEDTTFTAQWSYIDDDDDDGGSGSTTYAITVDDVANGTVSVSRKSASKGSTITVTVTPDAGYELDKLTVTDKDGDSVKVTDKGNGKYTFTMPGSKVTVTARFAKEGSQGTTMPFTDVATGEWYYEAVQYVYEKGMMNGMSATTFGPNNTTTRGMIVTMLYRLEGEPTGATANFTDVAAGQWYANAVNWASANNIVNGYGDGKFGPDDTITREQMATILYRYAQYKGYDVSASASLAGYSDAANVSSYAVTAMQWAVGEGLINGITNTTLVPGGSATRAQVAAIFMRFCENQ